jgi:hypothetical protein
MSASLEENREFGSRAECKKFVLFCLVFFVFV